MRDPVRTCVLPAALLAVAAHAQESDTYREIVVVIASMREQNLAEAPAAVT